MLTGLAGPSQNFDRASLPLEHFSKRAVCPCEGYLGLVQKSPHPQPT